jgi:hypothetical protein
MEKSAGEGWVSLPRCMLWCLILAGARAGSLPIHDRSLVSGDVDDSPPHDPTSSESGLPALAQWTIRCRHDNELLSGLGAP